MLGPHCGALNLAENAGLEFVARTHLKVKAILPPSLAHEITHVVAVFQVTGVEEQNFNRGNR